MPGDFSRVSFDPRRHDDGVLLQQGRPQLDADWNEQSAITAYRRETLARDLVGLAGAPRAHAGFGIHARAALTFDGVDDVARVSESGGLRELSFERFTFDLRVTRAPGAGAGGVLVSTQRTRHSGDWLVEIEPDGHVAVRAPAVHQHDGAGDRDTEAARVLVSDAPLAPGVPAQVMITCDGERMRIVVDGREAASGACPANGHAHRPPAVLGGVRSRARFGRYFAGTLEDVSLRDAERLIAAWPMVGLQTEELLLDASGNGHDLVLGDTLPASRPRWSVRDVLIGQGRFYVNGLQCENEASVALSGQTDCPGALMPDGALRALIYLDVWKRLVSASEDARLREIALGSTDTSLRSRVVWQVRALPLEAGSDNWHHQWQKLLTERTTTGRLRARRRPASGSTPGNQLYRVEIHVGGAHGAATFKWSRDNGSLVVGVRGLNPVTGLVSLDSLGHDAYALQVGDCVEYVDDTLTLGGQPGSLLHVVGVDRARNTLTVSPQGLAGLAFDARHHPQLRRWDQADTGALTMGADGWVALENGIEVQFEPGHYQTGDFWLIPARTASEDVEWPADNDGPLARPPMGIEHHRCPLALVLVEADGAEVRVVDERRIFETLTDVGRIEDLPQPAGGRLERIEGSLTVEGRLSVHGDADLRGDVAFGRLAAGSISADQLAEAAVGRDALAPSVQQGLVPAGYAILGPSRQSPPGFAFDGASLDINVPPWHRLLELDGTGLSAAAALGGRLYLVSVSGGVWLYEIGRTTGEEVARLEAPRSGVAVAIVGHRLLLVGGVERSGLVSGAVDELDLRTYEWTQRLPVPRPRRQLSVAHLSSALHVVGGLDPHGSPVATHDLYRVDADSWSARAMLPVPRSGVALAAVDDRLFALGGEQRGAVPTRRLGPSPRNDEYEPALDRWVERHPLKTAHVGIGAVGHEHKLVVGGGRARGYCQWSTYDPACDWWSEAAPFPRPAGAVSLVAVQGDVLAVGADPGVTPVRLDRVLSTLYVHRRVHQVEGSE